MTYQTKLIIRKHLTEYLSQFDNLNLISAKHFNEWLESKLSIDKRPLFRKSWLDITENYQSYLDYISQLLKPYVKDFQTHWEC